MEESEKVYLFKIYFCQEKLLQAFEIQKEKTLLGVLSSVSSGFFHIFDPEYKSLSCRKVHANDSYL